jgi:uncharacterized protein (TIGR03067 family)
MKYLASLVAALFVVTVVGGEEKKEAKFDPAKLVGDWTYVSGTKGGENVPKENLAGKVTFTKDMITVPAGPDMKFLMAYTLDTKETPTAINIDIKDGPVKEGKALGIVSLEGDELKLCYTFEGAKRPAKFESTKENKAHYFVLKRAK